MATQGTIRSDFRTGFAVQLVWKVTSQSIANNTSTVNVKVQLVSTGSSYNIDASATKSGSVSINGSTYKFTFSAALNGNQVKTINERNVTIQHNSNGAKSCSFGFSVGLAVTLSGTPIGTVSKSGTGTFNTIPRATTLDSVTSASKYVDSAITYKYSTKSAGFYNKLVVSVGSSSLLTSNLGAKATTQQTESITLNASQLATIYSRYTNSISAILVFKIETYSDSGYSKKVGTSVERKLTLTFPNSLVPTISDVAISEAVTGIAQKFGAYVQSKSRVKVVTTATGVNGSTIASIRTTINGVNYTGATITSGYLSNEGNVSISISAVDSRGRSVTASRTITVVSYASPKLNSFTGFRALADGVEKDDGTHLSLKYNYSISPVNNKNDSSYLIEYKVKNSTIWTTLYSGTGYSLNTGVVSNPVFSPDNAYDLRMKVSDYFSSDSITIDIPTAFTLMDLKANGKGLAIGKVAEKDGFEVGIPAYFSNAETPSSAIALKDNTDLNTVTTSGFYTFSSTAIPTLLNLPIRNGSGAVVVFDTGDNQKSQILVNKSNHTEIWERTFQAAQWLAWNKIHNGLGKVLWVGGYFMAESQQIVLPERISEQANGVVFVFTKYANKTAIDNGYNSFFIPKRVISEKNGISHVFTLCPSSKFELLGSKTLYIHDDKIVGHIDNKASGTSASGITYNNANFVLRYIIGV